MADYRRFLGVRTTEVAAYFGGDYVEAAGRRLRVRDAAELSPGWWTVEATGRDAAVVGQADAPDLSELPTVRGHVASPYLIASGGRAERLEVMGAEEPARFAPVAARRWPSGDLLYDAADFETGVEDEVRAAYEDGRSIGAVKGVPSTLRAAFGYSLVARAATAVGTTVAAVEVVAALGRAAEGGPETARRIVADVVRARSRERAALRPASQPGHDEGAERRAEDALRVAGARLVGVRRLDGGLLEVRFRYEGERFAAVVEAGGLGVVDAGICLSGHDRVLTLESLPSVIREAMATSRLYITNHG